MLSLAGIESARNRLDGIIEKRNFIRSNALSDALGLKIFLKLENVQKTGSFKIRGAYNFVSKNESELMGKGIVTASAGNHAQAVAFAASEYGIDCDLYMPRNTPLVKVESCKNLGGNVHLEGRSYDEAYELAKKYSEETGKKFINAFNDYDVIEGQGTIGLEIIDELEKIDYIVVPVGGGGLISGISYAVKQKNPSIKIIGVQAREAASAYHSLKEGAIAEVPSPKTIADGIAVKKVGDKTLPIIQKYVDDLITVEEEDIAAAVLMFMEKAKLVAEGAGAVPLAAVISEKIDNIRGNVVLVVSGGNIDVNLIERIIHMGLLRTGRLLRFYVDVDDVPGMLSGIAGSIGDCEGNILQISHERTEWGLPVSKTRIEITVETKGYDHIDQIIDCLKRNGFKPFLRS
ncbi:MAG: threonine ammonia-lyase [Candidatus Schekmanbacteria bacterium]|nr:MAG: threonine ammonia-lyase [Candidatus Schekmanbacteria bacterium]